MNELRMKQVARVLRATGSGRVMSVLRGDRQMRLTVSHFLDDGHTDRFRRLVMLLAATHRVVGPDSVLRAYAADSPALPAGRTIAFSFDDGLLSSYKAAQEVLNPLGIKAMFFVPTHNLQLRTKDEMREFFERRFYRAVVPGLSETRYVTMTSDHLLELQAQGHKVLPHTHTHAALSEILTPADVDVELRQPRERLEDLLGAPAPVLAFPFGHERVVSKYAYGEITRLYDACATGLMGANTPATPRHALYRDCVHTSDSADYVADVTAGALDVVYALKMRRLKQRAGLAA